MKREHPSDCSNCSAEERILLYNVRHRGLSRRLCAACVLKLHPGSFCPICFTVYGDHPPADRRVCLKCSSVAHSSCVGGPDASASYECPPCSNPSFLFFQLNKKIKPSSDSESDPKREIDLDSAKALLAAARIASASMAKAVNVARVEAERRVREAALAKRRAREALERVAYLVAKDKEKNPAPKVHSKVDTAISVQKRIQNQLPPDGIDKDRNGVAGEPKDIQNHSTQGHKD
ncbi:uncharacterized protein LOC131151667 [Malania oleifera]|uniref:uncharacterized protein LOC131151667 n=1 Tax=Malania oleifera TaxID=397392 RepID=UPI0025AE2BDB|nr:uncharacterized protein LOC131151667 [Malania oleifera]